MALVIALALSLMFMSGAILGFLLGRHYPIPSPPKTPVRLEFHVGSEVVTMLQLKATQKCRLSIVPKDAENNVASVQNPQFSVSDPSVGELVNFSDDGLSCDFLAGTPGTGQVSVTADADLGEGESPITGVLDVTVLPGDATVLELSTGPVEDQ